MNLRRTASLLFLTVLPALAEPAPLDDATLSDLGIADVRRSAWAEAPAGSWDRALMTGSGETGALVMGRPADETIILSRGGLFLPLLPPHAPPSQGAALGEIRTLLAAGEYQKAADFVYALAQKEGYEGTHWVDPFMPVCSLRLVSPGAEPAEDYVRAVDYATGVVSTRWRGPGGVTLQRVFASRADDVVVVELQRGGRPFDVDLGFVQHDPRVAPEDDRPDPAHFRAVEARAAGSRLEYRAQFAQAWEGSATGALALAEVSTDGGEIAAADDRLQVRGARSVLVRIKVTAVSAADAAPLDRLARELADAPARYAELLARHVAVHGEIFKRSRLDLGGTDADHRLPAKALFARSPLGSPLPALLEKQYDACRYLILSSTGKRFPPTLQGIWAGTWRPPWSSAFTHDGNLPVAVIGNLPGAMPELMEGFFRYHENHLEAYRRNARTLFNARGIVVPAHSTSHGLHNHFGPRWCLTFWSAGAGWAAHSFYDSYLYTGDLAFLRERAVPFMREVALFYEDLLAGMEGPDGRYVFSPSYSPENDPANTGSQATINATMDMVVCREVLSNLIAACERLGLDEPSLPRWRAILKKLPAYRINAEGALAEWISPALEDNHAHRHVSHLYEVYDGLRDSLAADPALLEAFKVAVQKRTAWRRQIGGGEMAFGQAQMGAVAASLRLPDIAFENLDMLSNWFWFPESLMTTHNPQSLFNTDIAGGIPQLVILMLVDAQPGWIELLPALPAAWPSGRIEGARLRGQVEVTELAWTPESVKATFRSPIDQTVEVRLRVPELRRTLVLKAGEPVTVELARTAR